MFNLRFVLLREIGVDAAPIKVTSRSIPFDTSVPNPKTMECKSDKCSHIEQRTDSVQHSEPTVQRFHLRRNLSRCQT